jgi:ABC-type bacteriocin/lantibiotic exporter with double-glycine peptidase domain
MNAFRDKVMVFNQLKGFYKNYLKKIVLLIVISLLTIPCMVITPYLYKVLIDDVLIAGRLSKLILLCIGYCLVFILQTVLSGINLYFSNKVQNGVKFHARSKIWVNYMKMNIRSLEKFDAGDLKLRIDNDVNLINSFLSEQIIGVVLSLVQFVIYAALLFYISWRISIVLILVMPLAFLLSRFIAERMNRINAQKRELSGRYATWLQGSIVKWREIKAFGIEKRSKREFMSYQHQLALLGNKWVYIYSFGQIFNIFKYQFLLSMALYFFGGIFIVRGDLTVGSVMLMISYFGNAYKNFESVINANITLSSNKYTYNKLFEILNYNYGKKNNLYKGKLKGNITINNVNYSYGTREADELNDITLSICEGEKVAIVGRSGHGKTTLLKCILHLCIPQNGRITFNDIDINDIDDDNLYKRIGVVMQDSLVFNLSFKENLLLAKHDAEDGEIKDVCRNVEMDDFIMSLPDGYDTPIGERGVKLSGGQRQRLAIARVLLKEPDIILFDEATSSLDHETELKINETINRIVTNKTMIIVAHRLASVLMCKRIIVIDEGRVVGDGSFDELIADNEVFRLLYKEQYENSKASS